MTGPECAVMCIKKYIHTYIFIHTYIHTYIHCEWLRMTRITGSDCVDTCNCTSAPRPSTTPLEIRQVLKKQLVRRSGQSF